MATGPRYKVAFRRRREGRTDYYVRRKLLRGGMTRAVVRRSARNVSVQFADFDMGGDTVAAAASSRELKALGWEHSCSSIPAAYLTGYLAGKKALKAGIEEAVLDIGMQNPKHGGVLFATVSGMRDILKIYLTRNLVLALLFIAIYIFVGYLPMLPIQNTYYAFVSVTIMAFFMTLFAKPDNNKELILPDVLRFCVPSAIMIAAFGLAVYGGFWWLQDQGMLNIDWAYMASIHGTDIEGLLDFYSWGIEVNTSEIVARSAMLFFITTAGILQMLLVSPRYRFLSPDGRTNKSLIPIILVVFVFLVIYAMYAYFPAIAVNLVELVIFPNEVFLLLIGITAVWFFAELFVLKKNVFKHAVDRFETLYMKKLQDAYTEGDVKEDD